jgi:hypothetical protein
MDMKRWFLLLLSILVSSCSSYWTPPEPSVTSDRLVLQNHGPAPELTNEVWLNSEQPLRLESLRGKVVLLEMWTFG